MSEPPPTELAPPSSPSPPRSSSPPLPPRRNAHNLPPSYLSHLQRLLRQWLVQQPDDSQPPHEGGPVQLWSDEKISELERAVWEGAVLEISAARRVLCRLTGRISSKEAKGERRHGEMAYARQGWKRVRREEDQIVPQPLSPLRLSKADPRVTINTEAGPSRTIREENDDGKQEWCRLVSSLEGFQKLRLRKKDEWDIVDDDFIGHQDHAPEFPGAFPQSQHYEPSSPVHSNAFEPKVQTSHPHSLLKPVFCLHFPCQSSHPPPAHPAPSRLVRDLSIGSTGSNSSKSWWGSGRRWSEVTLHPGDPAPGISCEWVEDKYALPMPEPRRGRPTTPTNNKRRRATVGTPYSSATEEGDEADAEDESDGDSTWSGTQRGSKRGKDSAVSVIISGDKDDIPRQKDVAVVGGTFVVRGTKNEDERLALERVFRVLIYTVESMFLELSLLDAFRMPRELDPPLPPPPKPKPDVAVQLKRQSSLKEKGVRKGFFGRLGKESRVVWDGLVGRSRRGSGGLAQEKPLISLESAPSSSISDRTLDIRTDLSEGLSTGTSVAPMERHLLLLAKLENLLPSTTPGLRIGMPPLLLRLREEDRIRKEKALQELKEDGGGSGAATPGGDFWKGRALAYRLGGDVRAGLGAISLGIESFEGWRRLQRLETLCCMGVVEDGKERLCARPRLEALVFFEEKDKTLIDLVEEFEAEKCERAGCEVDVSRHQRWWIHAGKKIQVAISHVEEKNQTDEMDCWMSCAKCGTSTSPRAVETPMFSWGKLMEILLYSTKLIPSTCTHMSRVYHIRSSSVLSIKVSDATVLDTRLPKLQVGPNVAKRKPGKAAATTVVDGLLGKEVVVENAATIRKDIERFFLSLEGRVVILRERIEQLPELATSKGESVTQEKETLAAVHDERLQSLSRMSEDFHHSKASLNDLLGSTPPGQINNVRKQFALQIKSATARVSAWQKQHQIEEPCEDSPLVEPEYVADPKVHALPGSSVLVREDEPSSIIAYTLSSLTYFSELTNTAKVPSEENTTVTTGPSTNNSPTASSDEWTPTELWSAVVVRRETPRDLLSLRSSLNKKRSDVSLAPAMLPMSITPNTASLELSLEQVEGKSQASDRLGDLVRTIEKATAQDPILTMKARSPSMSESDGGFTPRMRARRPMLDDGPPSAFRATRSVSNTIASTPITPTASSTNPKEGWSSVTSSFSNSFNQLIKTASDVGESIGSFKIRGSDRSLSALMGPLSMMSSMDAMDDRPHIQFSYSIGDRLKFGCTVFYAMAFDNLRRRCAIDKSVIGSLSRCSTWDAQGGKSKASFFMTHDKRYIVKELVSKWNVSDTHALLEIGPAYFEHLAGTHNKATSLAKIVGFYSIKIQDLQANTKRQMDLLVMENLFYKQTVNQMYDLKGIEGRRVGKMTSSSTLFDGEWLEGQHRAPVLLHPHAKRILHEAVANDTKFLSNQSVMDYSLLLGLDEDKKEMVVGLVDAIGSYNLFKTIESRGKLALNRGGEVTIIPPDQYRDRFETSLRQYFVACPDKWSKTTKKSGTRLDNLPSVL
ncbi:hypothetical protein P7C73_g5929, partial [Tremellales sp. Uapishka_1]